MHKFLCTPIRNCFDFLQTALFYFVVFAYALSVFLAVFAALLRQIARYPPLQSDEYTSKSHLKSLAEKIKTVSYCPVILVGRSEFLLQT